MENGLSLSLPFVLLFHLPWLSRSLSGANEILLRGILSSKGRVEYLVQSRLLVRFIEFLLAFRSPASGYIYIYIHSCRVFKGEFCPGGENSSWSRDSRLKWGREEEGVHSGQTAHRFLEKLPTTPVLPSFLPSFLLSFFSFSLLKFIYLSLEKGDRSSIVIT